VALDQEQMFYEVMWRVWSRQDPYPIPWWVKETLRRWIPLFDEGLFDSKEAALSSNALYRYWQMIGVKDIGQKSLVGQGGEIEPVYEAYAVGAFLYDPGTRQLYLPQRVDFDAAPTVLSQQMDAGYLPVVVTTYQSADSVTLIQKAFATVVGARRRAIVVDRLSVVSSAGPSQGWLCVAVLPVGPSSFQRHDRAGRYLPDRQISYLHYVEAENRVEVNTRSGPLFDTAPATFGTYGNAGSGDPDWYLENNPFHDLAMIGTLNGFGTATDHIASMCTGVFAWPYNLGAGEVFTVDIRLPVDDFRGPTDLAEIRADTANNLEASNRTFWLNKLDGSGLQIGLPALVAHLFDEFRLCRANLQILSDAGEIHPGPTIYDSFWFRDSSVEGIACALVGDSDIPGVQFGTVYPNMFNSGPGNVPSSSAALKGFFGGDHEKTDLEWDSNGEALWAFGRFDRISGPAAAFGARIYSPYVIGGARWLRDNRSSYGLLLSGWSAEHLGDKDKPHYWDDLWGVAGLYEAARLADRLGAAEKAEIWSIYDDLRTATADSIRWVLTQQRALGQWETYIPTGPADVGRLDSTMIGAVAYFHPCRLYMGAKLGDDIDIAARMTLETIWAHFVSGGFRHDAAWNAYGGYLTLQLAHAFMLTGDIPKMDDLLKWAVGDAAYASVSRIGRPGREPVVEGVWNEQHCYPIATDFTSMPSRWWYMGDIPHGWAAAEFNLLLRDICLFEADEDGNPHIFIAAGVPPHWLAGNGTITINDAPTIFGATLSYTLSHNDAAQTVTLDINQPSPNVAFIYPCRLGNVLNISIDGMAATATGPDIAIPPGTRTAVITYG
jgi:hypothetical protein